MEKTTNFHLKIIFFTAVKNCSILHGHVFVMVCLNTSNFDDDPIKNEQASMETSLSHYRSMGYLSDTQGHLTASK